MRETGHYSQDLLLGEFLQYLRLHGFAVGVDDYLQLYTLLMKVGTRAPDELKTILCPIFATNKVQQELFCKAFDSYFQLEGTRPRDSVGAEAVASESQPPVPPPPAPPRVRVWPYVLSALLLGALLFGAFYVKGYLNEPVDVPEPVMTPTPQFDVPVLPTAAPAEALPESAWGYALSWVTLLLPLICLLLFQLYSLRRRALSLQNFDSGGATKPLPLAVEGRDWDVYESGKLHNVARLLRRRQVAEFGRLDLAATIGATVRAVGYFTPVYKANTKVPEYVALIDRASYTDHQARMFDVLCHTLRSAEVLVTRYFYDGDPRVCFRPPFFRERPFALLSDEERRKAETAIDLSDVSRRHYGSRLLVFGDGEGFIDPVTGEPEPWLTAFKAWGERAVLTPVPTAGWGRAEGALSQYFLVLPATLGGLQALVDALELKEGRRPGGRHDDGPLPPASASQRSGDIEDLRYYLGPDGFQWLCACAVYPQLQWDLTLYMGVLINPTLLREASLLRLVRLPWFRTGQLPDDLRQFLLSEITPQHFKVIREALAQLMLDELLRPISLEREILPLKVAVPWRLFKSKPRPALDTPPRGRVFRDRLFVNFLESSPGPFDSALPRPLRRLLYRRGNPTFGMRGGAKVLAALLVMFAAWLLATGIAGVARIPPLTSYLPLSPIPTPSILEVTPTPSPEISLSPTPTPADIGFPAGVCLADLNSVAGYTVRSVDLVYMLENRRREAPPFDLPVRKGEAFAPANVSDASLSSALQRASLLNPRLGYYLAGKCVLRVPESECAQLAGTRNCVDVQVGVTSGAPAPGVTDVEPRYGPLEGGTMVVIRGLNLRGVSSVAFGRFFDATTLGTEASISSVSDNAVVVIAPPHAQPNESVDIKVSAPGGSSIARDAFIYTTGVQQQPRIQGVIPSVGLLRGGYTVRIVGDNLTSPQSVLIGNTPAPFTIPEPNVLAATAPPGSTPGPVDVVVITAGGRARLVNGFIYQSDSAPTLASRVVISFEDESGRLIDLCSNQMLVKLSPIFTGAGSNRPASVTFNPRTCKAGETEAVFDGMPLGTYRVEAQSPVPPKYYHRSETTVDSASGESFRLRVTPSGTGAPYSAGSTGTARCGARIIYCTAPRCECMDGVGCVGYDQQGNAIPPQTQFCPGGP